METITRISGGVCAPDGFTAVGMHSGIAKKADKKDLALIVSETLCTSAAVYTQNKAAASPIKVTKTNLADHKARAIICNSGNANACNPDGDKVATEMCRITAQALGMYAGDVLVASTGVIGKPLDIIPIEQAMPALVQSLSKEGSTSANQAIMTTDLREKEIAVSFMVGSVKCKIGAIAKGSGMIHPNMATMLCFITTDVDIEPQILQQAISLVSADTFNMVSVDGDTSTNDIAIILANGMARNRTISSVEQEGFHSFVGALMYVCIYIARLMARDGEGATKLLECSLSGAPSDKTAKILAKSVICSSLLKAAMFGADANWGRVLCALGYAPCEFDIAKTSVKFLSVAGEIIVCENGTGLPFDEDIAKKVLSQEEIEICIDLNQGDGCAVAWGCDLTYDYVKINGDYRS